MTIRETFRLALAVFLVSVFGITMTAVDLVPVPEVAVAGIVATGADLVPAEEVPVAGITATAVDLIPVPDEGVAVAGISFNAID